MGETSSLFLPAESSGDTVEGLHAEQGTQSSSTSWLLLFAVGAALASLPLVEVDVSVRAAGLVRPSTERAELRSPVSGPITQVLARDNERVSAGQPILTIGARDLEERLARNRERQSAGEDLVADLRFLTANSPEETGSGASDASALTEPSHRFRTAALRREQAQLDAQLASNQLAGTKARNEYDRYATLAAKGIASRSELDRSHYEVERLAAEEIVLVRQTLARWQLRLREEESALADLLSEENRLEEELAHFTIRAPVEGMLIGFNSWSAGGFISVGQSLGAVSPADALRIEALVSPRDIGLIAVGQPARISVDAFPYVQWGTLPGSVVEISGDSLGGSQMGGSAAAFKVVVRPAATMLFLPNGVAGGLRKGLTVQTRFLVARRSLLALLSDSASAWLDPQRPAGPGR